MTRAGAHGSTRRHPRGRAGERGVALIEAAFVTPIFMVLIFGMVEFGLVMNNYLGVANAARAGARVASASGNSTQADFAVLQAVAKESTAIKRSDIVYIVVFKASATGDAPTAACQSGTATSGVCNVYVSADLARPSTDFGCGNSSPDRYWCPSTRKVAQSVASGGPPDYIGVWVKVTHHWVTKMFGSTKSLTDSSVIRLEPLKL